MSDLSRVPPAVRQPAAHRWWSGAIDVLTAAAVILIAGFSTLDTWFGNDVAALVWAISIGLGVTLLFRRRWPVAVLGIVLGVAITGVLLGISGAAMGLAVAVAIYPAAAYETPRRATSALVVTLFALSLTLLGTAFLRPDLLITPDPERLNSGVVPALGFSWFSIALAWALGCSVRARREHATEIAEHRARQAVADERLRIAREMHDVVAHSMSVIVMKAAVANHVYESRPEEARASLGVIESVGRAALADIGRVLGSLRSAEDGEHRPSPDLDAVSGLVDNARAAGVDVALDRDELPELPAAVQLSAYRILQEALTNVIKHAAPARCAIRISMQADDLCLDVVDDGEARHPIAESGHGLIGMRERAALHAGTLLAEPRPDGGFAVHARLPIERP